MAVLFLTPDVAPCDGVPGRSDFRVEGTFTGEAGGPLVGPGGRSERLAEGTLAAKLVAATFSSDFEAEEVIIFEGRIGGPLFFDEESGRRLRRVGGFFMLLLLLLTVEKLSPLLANREAP